MARPLHALLRCVARQSVSTGRNAKETAGLAFRRRTGHPAARKLRPPHPDAMKIPNLPRAGPCALAVVRLSAFGAGQCLISHSGPKLNAPS